jgi:molybdate transport system substrate-binding protein
LKTGENNPAAAAFIEFLKGDEAAAIIKKYGYALDR